MIIIVEPTEEWRQRYQREVTRLKNLGLREDMQIWEEERMGELIYLGNNTLIFLSVACLGCYPFLKELCKRRETPPGMESSKPVFGVTYKSKGNEQHFAEIAKQDGWQPIAREHVITKMLDLITS